MADARLAQMISKMAHDLRSPLTSLKGFSGMLVSKWDRFDDAQKLEFVEAISFDARRMARMINEVIDLGRLEAGRLELKRTWAPLAQIARAAAEAVAHLDREHRVTLEIPEDLVVHADPDRLELVLSNLLENAIRFTEEGAITLAGRADAESVVITVRDLGPGIDEARAGEIFSGDASGSGAGVGLYLSRGIAELHGGALELDDGANRGSTFTVRLPKGIGDDD